MCPPPKKKSVKFLRKFLKNMEKPKGTTLGFSFFDHDIPNMVKFFQKFMHDTETTDVPPPPKSVNYYHERGGRSVVSLRYFVFFVLIFFE